MGHQPGRAHRNAASMATRAILSIGQGSPFPFLSFCASFASPTSTAVPALAVWDQDLHQKEYISPSHSCTAGIYLLLFLSLFKPSLDFRYPSTLADPTADHRTHIRPWSTPSSRTICVCTFWDRKTTAHYRPGTYLIDTSPPARRLSPLH